MGFREWLGVSCGVLFLMSCGGRASSSSDPGAAAGSAGGASAPSREPPTGPFAVSDYFSPSVDLGDADFVTMTAGSQCKTRPVGARGQCYRFDLDRGPQGWAGAFWLYPSANQGEQPGLSIPSAGVTRVTFKAALDVGESRASFFVGCVGGLGVAPNGDATCRNTDAMLTTEWQTFEIELDPFGLEPVARLVGGFGWALNFEEPSATSKVLYVDDLVFE